jgi:hypothetical protein
MNFNTALLGETDTNMEEIALFSFLFTLVEGCSNRSPVGILCLTGHLLLIVGYSSPYSYVCGRCPEDNLCPTKI